MRKRMYTQVVDSLGVIFVVAVVSAIWLVLVNFIRVNSPDWLITFLLALYPLAVGGAFQLGRVSARAEREGLAQGLKLKQSKQPVYNPRAKKEPPIDTESLNRALVSQRQTNIRVQRSTGAETVDLG